MNSFASEKKNVMFLVRGRPKLSRWSAATLRDTETLGPPMGVSWKASRTVARQSQGLTTELLMFQHGLDLRSQISDHQEMTLTRTEATMDNQYESGCRHFGTRTLRLIFSLSVCCIESHKPAPSRSNQELGHRLQARDC